jgi:zinc-binding in reverse transcriptase
MHSFYEWLDFGGVVSQEYDIVWKSKIPLKIKIFMWLVHKKKGF